jgi:hypothetical protein
MNRHEFVLYTIILVHVMIWIYLFVAWALPHGKWHVRLILSLLPLIFVMQSLPCHIFVYRKIKYINKHRASFVKAPHVVLSNVDRQLLHNISTSLTWDKHELEDLLKVVKYYEGHTQLPKLLHYGIHVFDSLSFQNPFTPQGLLIIAYMINVYASR